MAEGGEMSEMTAEEDMLSCPVCMEEYEDPRALPCLHTFCYKCLVQLTLKGAMKSPPEMKLASYIGNLLNFRDTRQSVLKCPLCSEEHPIPGDKGVGGFRKDFRINQLLEQRKTKQESVKKDSTDTTSDNDGKPDVDKCQIHPDEKLLYHCENVTCRSDICEKCWESGHDKHNVILLSKKVRDAKASLQQVVTSIIGHISSQIGLVNDAEKDSKDKFENVEMELKERYVLLQEKIKESFDQSFEQLEQERQNQERKLSTKLDDLKALQETFKKIQDDLETNPRAQTSVTFNEYHLLNGQMKHLNDDLNRWSFPYINVSLPSYNFTNIIKRSALVAYDEDNLAEENKEEKKEIDSKKEDKKQESKETSTKESIAKDPASKAKKKEVKKTDDEGKGSSSAAQKIKNEKASKKTADAETTSKANMQKGKTSNPPIPPKSTPSSSSITETKKMKLETSFRAKGTITSIAAAKDDALYVVTSDNLSRYNTSPVKKDFEKELFSTTDAMVLTTSKSDKVDLVVLLNSSQRTLSFYSLEQISAFVNSLEKESQSLLASAEHFICYVYCENDKNYVRCLSVENSSPAVSPYEQPVLIPFESESVRSICLFKSSKGNPIIVCTSTFTQGKTKKSDTGLVIVVVTKHVNYSKWTFNDLDSKASRFDLCSIACDKDSIFVLNAASNALYHASKTGKSVRKVKVLGASFPFSSATHMSAEPLSNYLYVATDKSLISKFTY